MNWIVIAIVAASLWGGLNWWRNERHESVPPGIVAPAAPAQTNLDPPGRFEAKGHVFLARARYELTARVLRKEIYRIDGGASLAPVDLGVGWGPMSDSTVVEQLDFTQMGRFLYWRPHDWRAFPLSPQDTTSHAAQIHAIPANDEVESRLRRLRPGQVVQLSGYLVDVRGPNGFMWNTSLRRDDNGDGACELMWIDHVALQ